MAAPSKLQSRNSAGPVFRLGPAVFPIPGYRLQLHALSSVFASGHAAPIPHAGKLCLQIGGQRRKPHTAGSLLRTVAIGHPVQLPFEMVKAIKQEGFRSDTETYENHGGHNHLHSANGTSLALNLA